MNNIRVKDLKKQQDCIEERLDSRKKLKEEAMMNRGINRGERKKTKIMKMKDKGIRNINMNNVSSNN